MQAQLTSTDIDRIADAVAKRLGAQPEPSALWNIEDVAKHLKLEKRSAERYVAAAGFPRAIKVPNADGGFSRKMWKRGEVVAYVERQK